MQNPTDQAAETSSIPTVTVSEDPNLNLTGAFTVRRKAAKRSESWYQTTSEPLPIPARKKPRRGEPLSTTTATDAATDHAAATTDSDHPVMNMHPIVRTSGKSHRWIPEEDVKLLSAVTNTPKKKWGKGYKTDWVGIAVLVPGKTRNQCQKRWDDALDPSIYRPNGRAGTWTKDEDNRMKEAVQKHGHKNWAVIAALVPGRTRSQCQKRWRNVLDPSIEQNNGRTGTWIEDEDIKLKEAVQKHGGKNWAMIATLVPGRNNMQCHKRWHNAVDPSIDNGRTGKWTEDEDIKLKDAVHEHGIKDWVTLAALVPGRTRVQCQNRWHDALNPSIDQLTKRTGKWVEDEDIKLKDAVQKHGAGNNWAKIGGLVPGRTKIQCKNRWHNVLAPSIDQSNGSWGKWTADEDDKLKGAVQKHGGQNWNAIASLVTGRTRKQCRKRWKEVEES
jgi:hypothetical protein